MREGMRIFTDYTNKWKGRAEESKKQIEAGIPLSFGEIKSESARLNFRVTTKSVPPGEQYKPELPMPKKLEARKRRVTFIKELDEIRKVAEYLFEDVDKEPSAVGEECFDRFLDEASK
jgi:hypothetical protein